mgnify:CR=1 FL=1
MKNLTFEKFENFFFGRVEIFFEHQGIRKILLRIECAHSQRSKITLKHTFKESPASSHKKAGKSRILGAHDVSQ